MAEDPANDAAAEQAQRGFHIPVEFLGVCGDAPHGPVHSDAAVYHLQNRTGADIRARAEHAQHHTREDQRQQHDRAEITGSVAHGPHSRVEELEGGN